MRPYGIVVNADLVEKAGHSVDDIKDFDSLKAVVEDDPQERRHPRF